MFESDVEAGALSPDGEVPASVAPQPSKATRPESSKHFGASPLFDSVQSAVLAVANQLKFQLTFTNEEHEVFLAHLGFTAAHGLPVASISSYMDWFMSRGLDIDRFLFKQSCLRGTKMSSNAATFAMEVMGQHGPGVYLVSTADFEKTRHYLPCLVTDNATVVCLSSPVRAFDECTQYIHTVTFIGKCVPKSRTGPPRKKAGKRRCTSKTT